ncbi:MAG TPA: HlyD family secretion protein, partial [Candidatus Acidoferrum sp.]|nr:HlyD family secretion protein [Candidatus Acidoferrum sp.]
AAANLAMVEQVVKAAQQNYDLSVANLAAAAATNDKAQMDVRRYRELLDQGVIARETNDQIVMTGKVDAAAVNSDRAAEAAAARAIGEAQAAVQAAQASLDQARLNLSYTKIYAPANGIVGRRTVELGSRIEPGQTLMFVTETDEIWVTADFKETQLARMHRGERVSVHVDTFGRDYQGYVRNLPGASGDRFSLLPAENATGNYVKVVQRLPVRIEFDPGQDPDHLLHPGMSVEPKVWLR